VTLTAWDDLDYLVIDLPPGTGDIPLTLAQLLNISAAIIVTTPQRLSFVDVVKGIDMFDTVNIPSVAVVENMASYLTYQFDDNFYQQFSTKILDYLQEHPLSSIASSDNTSAQSFQQFLTQQLSSQQVSQRIFGAGYLSRLQAMWGMEYLYSLPLVEDVTEAGDTGIPYVMRYPHSHISQLFENIAHNLIQEISRLQKDQKVERLVHDINSNMIRLDSSQGSQKTTPQPVEGQEEEEEEAVVMMQVTSKQLRCACRCAVCVEEMTGRKLLQDDQINDDIRPLQLAPIGRYAYSIDWSDGHKSLYPLKAFRSLTKLSHSSSQVITTATNANANAGAADVVVTNK
jgi:MinD-like ATPase involved in chromosome partitioning or flagellar assembly/DUF971 family protein